VTPDVAGAGAGVVIGAVVTAEGAELATGLSGIAAAELPGAEPLETEFGASVFARTSFGLAAESAGDAIEASVSFRRPDVVLKLGRDGEARVK